MRRISLSAFVNKWFALVVGLLLLADALATLYGPSWVLFPLIVLTILVFAAGIAVDALGLSRILRRR